MYFIFRSRYGLIAGQESYYTNIKRYDLKRDIVYKYNIIYIFSLRNEVFQVEFRKFESFFLRQPSYVMIVYYIFVKKRVEHVIQNSSRRYY